MRALEITDGKEFLQRVNVSMFSLPSQKEADYMHLSCSQS